MSIYNEPENWSTSFINSEFRELTNDQKSEYTFNGVIKGLIKNYEKFLKH